MAFGFGFALPNEIVAAGGASLNLQFAGATSLDPRITFTRASSATFTGSDGLVQTAAVDAPRLTYNPTTLAAEGLLVEEQRTNLLTYSQDFSTWTSIRGAIAGASGTAPDGTNTATSVSTADPSGILIIVTAGTAINTTISLFVKYVSGASAIKIGDSAGHTSDFDLSTGAVVGNFGGNVGKIEKYKDNWYRCSTTFTAATDGGFIVYTYAASSIYIWGAQLEAGAFATSYIPTTTAQATRAADVAVMTGTNFSSWYNQSEGTLCAEGVRNSTNPSAYPRFAGMYLDGSEGNSIGFGQWSATTTNGFVVVNSSSVVNIGQSISGGTFGTSIKSALAYKTNDMAFTSNGNTVGTDTDAAVPTVNQLWIGSNGSNSPLGGNIKSITYYPRRLANTELQALTA